MRVNKGSFGWLKYSSAKTKPTPAVSTITNKSQQRSRPVHWGYAVFCVLSLWMGWRLFDQDVHGHYRDFSLAARYLWEGRNPHFFESGEGFLTWLYSPSCGLFFFAPFSLLPEAWGAVTYMLVSWAVWVGGVLMLNRALFPSASAITPWPFFNCFWIGILSQMMSGIDASKLEVFMIGVVFLCMAWLIERRRLAGCAFGLAMIFNWKLQPFPLIGLWLVGMRNWKWTGLLLAGIFFWALLPFAVQPSTDFVSIYKAWFEILFPSVESRWLDYQSVFVFLVKGLGLPMEYRTSLLISAAVGALMAVAVVIQSRKDFVQTILLAAALGSVFMSSFSPLSQNNAFILYAPLLYVLVIQARQDRVSQVVLGLTLFVMSISYSKIFPFAELAKDQAWKSAAVTLAALYTSCSFCFRSVSAQSQFSKLN